MAAAGAIGLPAPARSGMALEAAGAPAYDRAPASTSPSATSSFGATPPRMLMARIYQPKPWPLPTVLDLHGGVEQEGPLREEADGSRAGGEAGCSSSPST